MVNHSLFKLVLFMSAGAIYMKCHQLDLNRIRGYGQKKPLLMLIFLSGSLGISGVPLFSGYISKTLIHESIVEYIELLSEHGQSIALIKCVEWIFLLSGGLTVAYMTKLFTAVFLEKNNNTELQLQYDAVDPSMNTASIIALSIPALLFPLFGSLPGITMQKIAELSEEFMNSTSPAHTLHWFSLTNLKGAVTSILLGAAIYFGFVRTILIGKNTSGESEYVNIWPKKLDIEESLYRPLCAFFTWISVQISSVFARVGEKILPTAAKLSVELSNAFANFGDKILPSTAAFTTLLISRIASSPPDWIVNGFVKTLLKPVPRKEENPADKEPGNLTTSIPLPDTFTSILENFSYGLLLFGIGLAVSLLFLIFSS
jgi:hydrogenase-4 component B